MPVEQLSITITADPACLALIRRFVISAGRLLEADVDLSVVGLLTSELTANAIDLGTGGAEVTVRCIDERLRVEVRDFGYGLPRVLHPEPTDDGGGRGLMIVEQLAHSWGVDQFLPGKIVWFEVGAEALDSQALDGQAR